MSIGTPVCKCVQSLQPLQEPDPAWTAHTCLCGRKWDPSLGVLWLQNMSRAVEEGRTLQSWGQRSSDQLCRKEQSAYPASLKQEPALPGHISLHLKNGSISLPGGSGWKPEQEVLSSLLKQPVGSVFKLHNSAATQKLAGHHHRSPASYLQSSDGFL